MFRRLAPAFVALGLGLAALGWGLVTLQGMFAEETEQAREQLRERRRAIELGASNVVRKQFKTRYQEAVERSLRARIDPLEPTRGLYWVHNDILIYPLSYRPAGVTEASLDFETGEPLELQRQFLREINRFTRADFVATAARIIEFSKSQSVAVDRFAQAISDLDLGVPILPYRVAGPTLLNQTWYLDALPHGEVRGCEAPLEVVLNEVAIELRNEGTIGPADRLTASPQAFQPMSSLSVELDMPELTAAQLEIERRYGLKNSMIAVCGLLAISLAVFGILGQRRKQRFLDLKSDFVATVSHELRTPLASIRLLAETLERSSNGAFDETIKQFPGRIVRVADGLHFLVENILSFNQVTKGRWVVEPKALRLDEVMNDLRNDLTDASAKPVRLSLAGDDVQLLADPALARLLFTNLGRNACAYNAQPTVDIAVVAERRGRTVAIRFTDNGIGIPGDEWENVFHDFYRLKATGSEVHGSGLGLALCRKIVDLHHGTIEIETSNPRGTTFALTFKSL